MKMFLATILLCFAIILIALTIHTNNVICGCIGGFLTGIYNAMIYYKKD